MFRNKKNTKIENIYNNTFKIFILIALLYFVGNLIYWKIETPIFPLGPSAIHFFDIFSNKLLNWNAPLITWITKTIFYIFGTQYFDLKIIFINYIFFLIALYFIYKTGEELKDKETGNIAMILFALTPAVYGMSRIYGHQDWHVMIAMTANIYCLIKSNNFKNRKWSILYGFTVGLGLLIKDEFLPYFFIPWLYVVIKSLIQKAEKENITNILITILIGCLLAGCHYFRTNIINKILIYETTKETTYVFSYDNFKIMTIGLSEYLLAPPMFILFIISLICFIKQKHNNKFIILLWIFIPWCLFTFMPQHNMPEYAIGFVPAIILIISVWISYFKTKIFKQIILTFIILVYLLQYIDFYGINFKLFNLKININNKEILYYDKKDFINDYYGINIKNYYDIMQNVISKNKKSIFYIQNMSCDILQVLYCIKNKKYKNGIITDIREVFCDNIDIPNNTIIIVIGQELFCCDILEFTYEHTYDEHKGKNKDIVIKEMTKIINKKKEYINKNFHLSQKFYLKDTKKDEHLVKIYKFNNTPQSNEGQL